MSKGLDRRNFSYLVIHLGSEVHIMLHVLNYGIDTAVVSFEMRRGSKAYIATIKSPQHPFRHRS